MITMHEDEFLNWVTYIFDHPVSQPKWYYEDEDIKDNAIASDGEKSIFCLIKLFEKPNYYLKPYTDEQINQGLYFLLSPGSSSYMFTITDQTIDIGQRIRLVSSFYILYKELFLPRCSDDLSYLLRTQEEAQLTNPLNSICYMWWDILPFAAVNIESTSDLDIESLAPLINISDQDLELMRNLTNHLNRPSNDELLVATALETLKNILQLDSRPCREGALHGLLDSWISVYPKQVEEILDDFITTNPDLDDDLINYAPGLLKRS